MIGRNIGRGLLCSLFFVGLHFVYSVNQVEGATPADFRTAEYYASTGLEIINAADAYALGYTGQGISLGICDLYVKLSHPEFIDKSNSYTILPVPDDYNWQMFGHGTRVAGIMAAARNNVGMMGLAFDSNIVSGTWFDSAIYEKTGQMVKTFKATYDAFNALSNVKIINNSWGIAGPGSLYMEWQGTNKADILQYYQRQNIDVSIFANSINDYDKVLVFAAGNCGHTSAHAFALLPYTVPSTANNFIVATMVDPTEFNKTTNTASNYFLGVCSDLTKYVEENSVASPGWNINSTVAAGDTYGIASGTSFSAPYVTAVAGLVQQAFPYMNGKQIVDTILSSANNSFSLPEYSLTLQTDYPAGQTQPVISLNMYYIGSKPSQAVITANLTQIFYDKKTTWESLLGSGITLAEFLSYQQTIYDNVPREMLFGQGLLDVAAAVCGPALLNARRMDSSNFSSVSEYYKDQALYKVDTQGYNSIWSNDIEEKRAGLLADQTDPQYADLQAIYRYYKQGDQLKGITTGQEYIDEYNAKVLANGLQDLPVGLLKYGLGTLALTGQNTYTGSSIATAGVLQIDGSITGDAFSVGTGTIAGSGIIGGNLYNFSIVQAGSYGAPGTMTVQGNLISSGMVAVAANNSGYSKIVVDGSANVDGSSFAAVSGSIYQPEYVYTDVITANSLSGNFAETALTGMLSASGNSNGALVSMNVARANNLGSLSSGQSKAYNWVQSIFNDLYGQTQQRQLDQLYSLAAVQASTALTAIYGGAQINQAAFTQRDISVQTAVANRLLTAKQPPALQTTNDCTSLPMGAVPNTSIVPLTFGDDNSWWMNVSQGWGTVNADCDLPALSSQTTTVVIGRDKEIDANWRTGLVLAYVNNQIASSLAQTQSQGMKFGAYAGYSNGPLSGMLYLDYGKQNNNATRSIPNLALQANSNYGSQIISADASVRYNLTYESRDNQWQVSPYLSADVVCFNQDAYQETGAGVLNQTANQFQNTYNTGGVGFEFARVFDTNQLLISLGYKKVLSGNNPQMTVTYNGMANSQMQIAGNYQDSDYAVVKLNYQGPINENWSFNSQIWSQQGSSSSDVSASLLVSCSW